MKFYEKVVALFSEIASTWLVLVFGFYLGSSVSEYSFSDFLLPAFFISVGASIWEAHMIFNSKKYQENE